MQDLLAIRQFRLFQTSDNAGQWCQELLDLLVNEFAVPSECKRSWKLLSLLFQAERLGTQTIVIHDGYYCRDYIGDYGALHSKIARPSSNRCVRLLFFNKKKTESEVFLSLKGVSPSSERGEGDRQRVGLVGTAVLRPTPDCIVGRTVMEPCKDNGFIPAAQLYSCHLYGTPLYVRGVPWLEQDPSLFVCGGAALWTCAFHTQIRWGLPHYYPGELTAVARSQGVDRHVAGGMTAQEIATAIQEWGFEPFAYISQGGRNLTELLNCIHALIESNIVPIVCYWSPGGAGHAVVAVGHGLQNEVREGTKVSKNDIRPTSDWIDSFTVADDQVGPYRALPITDSVDKEQPLALAKVSAWSGIDVRWAEKASISLEECSKVAIVAPFPRGVRVRPDSIHALANQSLALLPTLFNKDAKTKKAKEAIDAIVQNPVRYALRAYLAELKDFHWDLRIAATWSVLAQDLREIYLQISWPTWIWIVQIVRTNGVKNVDWKQSRSVGEVLIDASASPRIAMKSLISARVGHYLYYQPEKRVYTSHEGLLEYPVVCP